MARSPLSSRARTKTEEDVSAEGKRKVDTYAVVGPVDVGAGSDQHAKDGIVLAGGQERGCATALHNKRKRVDDARTGDSVRLTNNARYERTTLTLSAASRSALAATRASTAASLPCCEAPINGVLSN